VASLQTLEVPVKGMDCTECTQHVQQALARLPGVESVTVLLTSEKAILQLNSQPIDLPSIRKAVASAGDYSVPEEFSTEAAPPPQPTSAPAVNFNRRLTLVLIGVFGAVVFVVVGGEWFGLFKILNALVPLPVGAVLVAIAGFPVFRNVIRAALKRQIIAHTLMSMGALAALAVGEWVTALVVVFFMSVGNYVEGLTTEGARRALKTLTALTPQLARLDRAGIEVEIPVSQVQVGDVVIVRPGEKIPVDGEVVAGQATVNQATITGESMPVEVGVGAQVFAATLAQLGSLRIKTVRVGANTTFGRIVKLVEEAEANRAEVQRFADQFSAYYLPVVATIATLTFLFSRNPLSTAAVLLVACSCSIALATPVAMLASIGNAAKRGLLIKGGKYIEALARTDIILLDKTGTLTLGQPQLTDIVPLTGYSPTHLLRLAASAERYSEHPLAEAIRKAAEEQNLVLTEPTEFQAVPGMGLHALVNNDRVTLGNQRLISGTQSPITETLERQGKTLLFMEQNGKLVGVFAAADTLRPEVPAAFKELRALGFTRIELLTGDNEQAASTLASQLGLTYRANLLPEDKIKIVKDYQAQGQHVLMIGDGVNDAPALAQANVGIAMGAAGTDIAMEAAHVILMRQDWRLVPDALKLARRTMGVVKMNLGFTAFYNVVGLALAALGFLPPIVAAAAQSFPDLGILANSARLLRDSH